MPVSSIILTRDLTKNSLLCLTISDRSSSLYPNRFWPSKVGTESIANAAEHVIKALFSAVKDIDSSSIDSEAGRLSVKIGR